MNITSKFCIKGNSNPTLTVISWSYDDSTTAITVPEQKKLVNKSVFNAVLYSLIIYTITQTIDPKRKQKGEGKVYVLTDTCRWVSMNNNWTGHPQLDGKYW